jgi:hypothetical protein
VTARSTAPGATPSPARRAPALRSLRARVGPALRRVEATARRHLPPTIAERTALDARRLGGRLGLAPSVPGPARPGEEAAECNICGHSGAAFLDFGVKRPLPDRRCPRCGSLERHRAVWLLLRDRAGLLERPLRMLHIAPEPFFAGRLRREPSVDYLSGDISSPDAMVRLDITAIDQPDASFDLVYAGHVLEHIPDDVRAMAEVHRVLRPGGLALLPVPMWGATTREDPAVTEPAERERRFGQADHVRMYGHDGVLEERLRSVGFAVEVVDVTRSFPEADVRRHRLAGSDLLPLCTKAPAAPGAG